MSARGNAAEGAAFDILAGLAPHQQRLLKAPAAYSGGNLSRLFIGRSEARLLSQVEHALIDYNKSNNTSHTILPNLLVRFKSQNRYHSRFIIRLVDPPSNGITAKDAPTKTQNPPSKTTTTTTTAAPPNSTTSAPLQYNLIIQPSASLVVAVNDLSNESPVKDNTALTALGAQEAARLERLMDQHALLTSVRDFAYAAWKLLAVRRWLIGLQKSQDSNAGSCNDGQQNQVVIKQEPGMVAPGPTTTAAPSRPQSGSGQLFSIQNIVKQLPALVETLNDVAAIRNLAAEIELASDGDNAAAGIGGDKSKGQAQLRQQPQEQSNELLSLIPFATKPPLVAPARTTANATIIKTEPEQHQINTGHAAQVPPTTNRTTPPSTNTTTTRNKNEKQFATPGVPSIAIKQEPVDNSQKGPNGEASEKIVNNSKSKQLLPSTTQKSTLPAKSGAGASKNDKTAAPGASASAIASEKKRKQEMDSAEKKRRDAIAWKAQPSHPEDQPLLPNENKKQKKKKTPPVVETLAPSVEKKKIETGISPTAGISSRYKDFFSNLPTIATTSTHPPPRAATMAPPLLPPTQFNAPQPAPPQPHISTMGTGNTPSATGASITCLVSRQRPVLERPRYIKSNNNENGAEAPTTTPALATDRRRWERELTRFTGVDIDTCAGEFILRPIPEAPQAPPPGANFSSWFDQMHVEPTAPPPPDEDIDPNARNTSAYFDELHPTIKTYGVFPECTIKIPAMLPMAHPPDDGEAALDVGVGGVLPSSLENIQFRVKNIVEPGSGIEMVGRDHNHNFIESSHVAPTALHATDRHQSAIKKPHPNTTQAQQTIKNANLAGDSKQKQGAAKSGPEQRGRRRSPRGYPSDDDDYRDDDDDDSRSRSTYSRSRTRSYSRSRSRSLPPQKKPYGETKLSPPKIWKDNIFPNDPNRPQVDTLRLERSSKCIWQLELSSRVLRSSMRWQNECFCPVWRYEMRLQAFLFKRKKHMEAAERVFKEHPLPHPYAQDFKTFLKFISSRSHLFEVLPLDSTSGRNLGGDDTHALIRVRDRACPLLEWKRRMLDYTRVEGCRTGCRVPLAEALLACPFPKDAPVEEVEEAQSNPHNYIISRLGDAVHAIQPRMWAGVAPDKRVSYPVLELRFFECDRFGFPKMCKHGLARCPIGPSCAYRHVPSRNWGKQPNQAHIPGLLTKKW